jgi:hypothetical protein
VLSTNRFRPLRFDCSIKEQGRTMTGAGGFWKAVVLHNFCTGGTVNNLGAIRLTGYSQRPCHGREEPTLWLFRPHVAARTAHL